jgi:hypothetical protein
VLRSRFEAVERRDVEAAVEARKELGPEYDDHLVDSLLAKLEERKPELRLPHRYDIRVPLISTGIGIGATGAANGLGGGGAVAVAIVAWIAIAIVNVAYAFRR